MDINTRIKAFVELGKFLKQFSKGQAPELNELNELFYNDFDGLIKSVNIYNPWFTEDNVRLAVAEIAAMLEEHNLVDWLSGYVIDLSKPNEPKKVAVIMAGNIPAVGFHDLLCVLMSGNRLLAKLSADDHLLLPFIANVLIAIEPGFKDYIEFTNGKIQNINAVIATGSDNSARYFEYYFSKYPHIIRKNRNSVAVLTGKETPEQLHLLGKDIFQYFGLGCRSVSKLFIPEQYDISKFYEGIYDYGDVLRNNKYVNNYEYNRTIYLMKSDDSLRDNNFLLLKQDTAHASPIGVLFYEYYNSLDSLAVRLLKDKELLQCIVAPDGTIENSIDFGKTQCPALTDYADGVDTMRFLVDFNKH